MGLVRVLKDKAPVLVLTSLCAGAAYAVYYAHHQQIAEKKVRVIARASVRPVVHQCRSKFPSCCRSCAKG